MPSERRTASVTADAAAMERRVFHGRTGTESDELLLMFPGERVWVVKVKMREAARGRRKGRVGMWFLSC